MNALLLLVLEEGLGCLRIGSRNESVPRCPKSRLPSYFALRDEALKKWNYFIANKLVYIHKSVKVDEDSFIFIPEDNLRVNQWLEVRTAGFGRERKSNFCATIQHLLVGKHDTEAGELNVRKLRMKRNMSMLVDVPQLIQSPQVTEF